MTDLSFEESFHKLEAIVERLNAPDITLEESLALFEEANVLLLSSQKRLQDAEQRIEVLMRSREGDLIVDEHGSPKTSPLAQGTP